MVDYGAILIALGVGGGERERGFRGGGGEEAGEAAAVAGGGGLGAGVGLAASAGALVEEGAVDLGDDEVVGAEEVEGGGGGEGEGKELRLGEGGDVDVGERVWLERRWVGGEDNRRRHFRTVEEIRGLGRYRIVTGY